MSLVFPEWFEGDPAPEAAAICSLEWEPIRAALKIPGLAAVAARLGIADSTVEAWSAGAGGGKAGHRRAPGCSGSDGGHPRPILCNR